MSAPRDDHHIALHLEISTYTVAYERFSARSTQSRIASTGIHFCTPNYPRSLHLKNTPRDHYLSTLCSPRSPVMPKYAKIGHSYCHEINTNECGTWNVPVYVVSRIRYCDSNMRRVECIVSQVDRKVGCGLWL